MDSPAPTSNLAGTSPHPPSSQALSLGSMPATEGAAWMLGSSPSMTESGVSLWRKYSDG
ncbi:hypothetical protein AMC79_CH00979 [Rhizobium phaseoli]|nr:hypothetical protein AMC89_CH00981 [Rhizobium phaseoli]ANL96813.1 hypothetical protein AMC79_CH00979 [Rhizobium phaseoli]